MLRKSLIEFARFEPRSRTDWRQWLSKNHSDARGVKLVLHKKNSANRRLMYDEAVEEALCFGWIDSKPNLLDATRYILHFSPRKPRSVWSNRNKERVRKLMRSGRMTLAGLSKIEAAKKDGSWSSLDTIEKFEFPSELKKALSANKQALKNFDSFPNSSKKIILYWIQSAKREETRTNRIVETVALAANNIRANHYRQRSKRFG